MNIILKIILFNIILYIALKYSLLLFCILILLFSFYMLYMYYNIDNVLEGNVNLEDYKMNFVGILNKNIKTTMKQDLLYNSILDNFTKLIELMDRREGRIPPNQMCKGSLGDWSKCTKECGRGKKTRRFNVIQKAGETGIDCIYENGQIESKECSDRLCKLNEECKEDFDCVSGLCSKSDKVCTYPHMCHRDKLYNCNFEQCQELERKYNEYKYDTESQRCINKVVKVDFEDFEINEQTTSLIESENKTIKENIITGVINNLGELCNARSDDTNVSKCSDKTTETECNGQYEGTDSRSPCMYHSQTEKCYNLKEYYDKLHETDDPIAKYSSLDVLKQHGNESSIFFC
jgi:hypothetical protein